MDGLQFLKKKSKLDEREEQSWQLGLDGGTGRGIYQGKNDDWEKLVRWPVSIG